MSFQLQEVTRITITNANPRREFHGEEKVRAIDLSFQLTGENILLDLIEPGLREHHYCNRALTAGQEPLPDIVIPLPNLRFPSLSQSHTYAKGQKWRGYRLVRDYGTDDARWDFTDVVLGGLRYETEEGGTVKIFGTISYNGEELGDDGLYGELSALACEGEIFAKLIAPGELVPAKKGYRAGRPDTPPPSGDDGQQELGDLDAEADADDLDLGTPEGALAATANQ